jgi:hypothetical protein
MIHHHGSDAATEASIASTLRSLCIAFPLPARRYKSRQVQNPITKTAESQVIT